MVNHIYNEIIKDIIVFETFESMPDIQKFENVEMILDIPFSEINFEKKDIKIALQFLTIKTICGFNNPIDHYEFYLNNQKINKNDLLLENDNPYHYINSFVEKNEIILKERNCIKIEFVDPCNFEYVKHIKIKKNIH